MQPALSRLAFAISGPIGVICLDSPANRPALANLRPVRLMAMRARSGRGRDPRGDFRPGSPQAPGERFVDACTEDELIADGALVDDFPGPMDLGEQPSVAGREANLNKRPAR